MSAAPVKPDSGVLFQEVLREEPFWMLVACILINRTHWRQVEPVLQKLRARCKGPKTFLSMPIGELIEILRPLGFYNRRASVLRRFALDWLDEEPTSSERVMKMSGCGEYAAQSFLIFVEGGRPPADKVTDHKLSWYLEQME
jgi:methyl-CpG-binding domain protein 4